MKLIHDLLMNKAHRIYQKKGQSGVFDWANKIGIKKWAYCEPCDSESPVSREYCLVCWSVIKELEERESNG